MASAYVNKYVSDVPLKRPRETFVDDPALLDEVSCKELEFDLANGIKTINSLHSFHAISIFAHTMNTLIALQKLPDEFSRFRKAQLGRNLIDLDQLQEEQDEVDELPIEEECSVRQEEPVSPVSLSSSPEEAESDGFISTELLLRSTSLELIPDPITCHSSERLKKEVAYHMTPKIRHQTEHLLRSFALVKKPDLTVEQFLVRIKTYLPSLLVLVYIHAAYMLFRLCVLLDVVQLNSLNVYRFILALVRCLTKKLEDIFQKQKNFATVGGVAPKDLCKIEVGFLYLCNFKLVVSEQILNDFLCNDFVGLCQFARENLGK